MISNGWISKVGQGEWDYENFTVTKADAARMLNINRDRLTRMVKAKILQSKENSYGNRIYIKDIHKIQKLGIPERNKSFKKYYKQLNLIA